MRGVTGWAIGVALLAGAAACGGEEPGEVERSGTAVEVRTSRPARGPGVRAYAATVRATEEAKIATRSSGTVREIPVDVGSRVKAGDTLVRIDAADVQARIQSARAGLRKARRYFDRIRALEEDGAATRQELDDARAGLETAEARLQDALAQQDYVVLTAPFGGWVTRRHADTGDLAVPGRPILALAGEGSLTIEADLPAEAGAALSPGDTLAVVEPGSGRRLPAEVVRTSSSVEPASRRIRIEARFAGDAPGAPELLPGSFLRLEVESREAPTTWIPADAVVRRGQLDGVYLVEDGHLRLSWVRLGRRRAGAVEVLAGVPDDARMVRRPPATLSDGRPVASAHTVPWSPAGGS